VLNSITQSLVSASGFLLLKIHKELILFVIRKSVLYVFLVVLLSDRYWQKVHIQWMQFKNIYKKFEGEHFNSGLANHSKQYIQGIFSNYTVF